MMTSQTLLTCQYCTSKLKYLIPFIIKYPMIYNNMSVPHPAVSKFQFFNVALNFKHQSFGLTTSNRSNLNFNLVPDWKTHQSNVAKTCLIFYRKFHFSCRLSEQEKRPVPKLLYTQNPLTWLVNKIDFAMLRRAWDPQFDENEFRRGTKQAISTITQIVSQNIFDGLKGMLTKSALMSLRHEVETMWSDEQRRHVSLQPEDIQLAIPRRIHFQSIVEQRFCDVDMVFLALKWAEHGGTSAIIFIEIIARFHREYSEECLPDWTVSLFRVTRFNILPR